MAGYPDMIELFPEIVVTYEVKSDEDVKVFTLKAIVKMYIEVCSFSKPRNNVQKFQVSEATEKKSLQKHLKIRIC